MTIHDETTTFLFTDIEASTSHWETTHDMHQRVEAHFDILRESVASFGGRVFALMGDGIAAAFGSAHAATDAAIAAQIRMPTVGLRSRMAIHTGEANRIGDDYRGRPVNRTARIMTVAHGGQILISDLSANLLRNGVHQVDLLDLGTHRLRDLAEAEHLWQVVHPELPASFPALRGPDLGTHNLPIQHSTLVGRDDDVARVVDLVHEHRIVSLTGVGGVGKTRLALHTAIALLADFDDVRFVEFANLSTDDDLASALVRAMGMSTAHSPLEACRAAIGSRSVLLVLDNCEHVIDHAASLVTRLSDDCPGLSTLVTTREALGVDGEHVMRVRTLDPDTAAAELFRDRAVAAGLEARPEDLPHFREICRHLDGIPLAIELAAARAPSLGVSTIVGELDNRFALLRRSRRHHHDRHATMRSTIDWSYRRLAQEEQRLFRHLAVFPNGLELDAVLHVAESMSFTAADAADCIESLVSKSMLAIETNDITVRYRLLETMRLFALERLDELDERVSAQLALTEWMCAITDLSYDDACNSAVERSAIRLEREADNWREAMLIAASSGSPALAARLCGAPVAFFLLSRHDLAEVVRPMLELCRSDPRQYRAVLCALMVSAAGSTPSAQLDAWATELEEIDERLPSGLGHLMRWLADVWNGDFDGAIAACVRGSNDPRIARSTQDLLLGIAVLDRFSLTAASDDPDGLIGRALETAARSDVALQRVSCRLGAAWGLLHTAPERCLELVRLALDDIQNVPALTRATLPGSASRLLASLDPRIAARGLLEQLDASGTRRTFVDLIPLSYATSLLTRVGHPDAHPISQVLAVSTAPNSVSMMDFVEVARRTAISIDPVSLRDIEVTVRDALAEVAADEIGIIR